MVARPFVGKPPARTWNVAVDWPGVKSIDVPSRILATAESVVDSVTVSPESGADRSIVTTPVPTSFASSGFGVTTTLVSVSVIGETIRVWAIERPKKLAVTVALAWVNRAFEVMVKLNTV